MEILRHGSEGEFVRNWQYFLFGTELLKGSVDGVFGPATDTATRVFQKMQKLKVDGVVGPLTYAAALQFRFDPGFTDPNGGASGVDWPPRPAFVPLISNTEREKIFGRYEYRRVSPDKDDIQILDGWEAQNIVGVTVPQLIGVKGAPANGRIRVHRLIAGQIKALFQAWEDDDLMSLIKTWEGSFVPRFIRGNAKTLSNHSWGAAFDVNYSWNKLGQMPALRGRPGSVRELVPRAHQLGFFWGGHFSRHDGTHFEVARVLG